MTFLSDGSFDGLGDIVIINMGEVSVACVSGDQLWLHDWGGSGLAFIAVSVYIVNYGKLFPVFKHTLIAERTDYYDQ